MRKVNNKSGFMLVESMGSLIIYLIMIGACGWLISSVMENSDLSNTEQALNTLRMNVKQVYTSASDYSGLTTQTAREAGIIPADMIKSNGVRNVWNGDVTVVAGADPNTFIITFALVPEDMCVKLATYQLGSWSDVQVNGVSVNQDTGTIAAIIAQQTTSNSLAFTSN